MTRWGLALASLAAVLLSGSDANAWCFKNSCCGPCYHHRLHCFETHITCRPYNAFTPICWGNLYCDGVCPNPQAFAAGCCSFPSYGGCMPGGCMAGGCMTGPAYPGYAGGFAPGYGGYGMGVPYQGAPYQGAPMVLPGAPLPQGVPTQMPNNNTAQYGYPMPYGVQPAGYPGYYYGYPTYNYPTMPYGNGYGQ
jgi:hypothetical protein